MYDSRVEPGGMFGIEVCYSYKRCRVLMADLVLVFGFRCELEI